VAALRRRPYAAKPRQVAEKRCQLERPTCDERTPGLSPPSTVMSRRDVELETNNVGADRISRPLVSTENRGCASKTVIGERECRGERRAEKEKQA